MGKISTYYEKQKAVKQLQDELQKMEEDKELKKELDFKEELNQLMEKYGKSGKDMLEVLATLDSSVKNKLEQGGGSSSGSDGRKKRPLKTYRNPHTGEVVQTRGGNHKTLNAWRKQYGKEEVARWQES
ncbi:histone-like nucleoid-structuring protein, MvaT/MvaU family [Halospina sp. K52047b]|uniref:histone-like nucleoid-structuring protein, MvaT/MvaU family n=1 Tax=Halospina sp. K52047b TaxID=2614160 RepID=UPI00124A8FDF|nr:histone-like nucleoid-structuring protein, MvaT/MvaU family [Halospina sp. K52047b]KAA8985115.1 DNA binding protein [Halospina sp. K52047b]